MIGFGAWFCGGSNQAVGQVSPNGAQFQVNAHTTHFQVAPSVASDEAGNFVVVWDGGDSSGTDIGSISIQGRRFDAAGNPVGEDFQVNSYTTGSQYLQSVASSALGSFVVVWESAGSSGSDTSGFSIQGQRYDADGGPAGAEFQVNSYTTNDQNWSAVASDAQGNFVVVWQSYGSNGSDTSSTSIQGQRYDDAGNPLGAQFQVNSYTTARQRRPVVASDLEGNFVVVWKSEGSSGSDTDSTSIQGQRYGSDGNPIGPEFQVNSYTTSGQDNAVVALNAQGGFVVVWESDGSSGSDTSGLSVQGQRFDADGDPLGPQFQVNTYSTDGQFGATVAADARGNFVVSWWSRGSSGTDTDGYSVQGQRYRANGEPIGPEFQINSFTPSEQTYPAVASDSDGDFVVAWESNESDGDPFFSIQAQRFDGVLRDGFETGDTGRWSVAVP